MSTANWNQDGYQFPRLLSEIRANVSIPPGDMEDLLQSMGITRAQLDELFDRAQRDWERVKTRTCPTPRQARNLKELKELPALAGMDPLSVEEQRVLLDDRDVVLAAVWRLGLSLAFWEELGKEMGVSTERVQAIFSAAHDRVGL